MIRNEIQILSRTELNLEGLTRTGKIQKILEQTKEELFIIFSNANNIISVAKFKRKKKISLIYIREYKLGPTLCSETVDNNKLNDLISHLSDIVTVNIVDTKFKGNMVSNFYNNFKGLYFIWVEKPDKRINKQLKKLIKSFEEPQQKIINLSEKKEI